jgi:hypothetical protein
MEVQTEAERLAEIMPANCAYPPGDIRRYGAVREPTAIERLIAAIRRLWTRLRRIGR